MLGEIANDRMAWRFRMWLDSSDHERRIFIEAVDVKVVLPQ
jgi:hypothetical protein